MGDSSKGADVARDDPADEDHQEDIFIDLTEALFILQPLLGP